MKRLLMGVCVVLSGAVASCASSTSPPNSSLSSMGAAATHAELAPAPPPTPTVKSKNAFRGAPISTNADSAYVFLKNKGYDIGYSESRKDPLWAAYTFRKDVDQFDVKRPKSKKFASDNRVNSGVSDADYTSSGYDRGHMAPSDAIGRWYGNDAQNGTFIVTNICPQKHNNNAGDWAGLEAAITDIYMEDFDQVWVICGPIFDAHPKMMSSDDISVPVSFFKIVVEDDDAGDPRVLAVIMDQGIKNAHELSTYLTTVRNIEGLTHLNFFPDLPKDVQDRIETAEADPNVWKTDTLLSPGQIRHD